MITRIVRIPFQLDNDMLGRHLMIRMFNLYIFQMGLSFKWTTKP